ncbi:MAG: Clp1/GlmU family protein [Candidatus Hodarchaeales archaeon]
MSNESEVTLNSRQWFLCRGLSNEGTVEFTKGRINIYSVPVKTPVSYKLIIGQSILGQAQSKTEVKLSSCELQILHSGPFPSRWSEVYLDLTQSLIPMTVSQKLQVIGAPDQGKTTFLLFLGTKLANRKKGIRVGWLDLDPGQNTLSWPGTLAYGEFSQEKEHSDKWLPVVKKYLMFGSTTPRGLLRSYRDILEELCLYVEDQNPDWLLIDTPGYIGDDYAREIHQTILHAVKPQNLFQLGDESFQLWCRTISFKSKRTVVFPTTKIGAAIQNRSQETRRQRREARYTHLLKLLTKKEVILTKEIKNVLLPTSGGWLDFRELKQFSWSQNQLGELEDYSGRKFLAKVMTYNDKQIDILTTEDFVNDHYENGINVRLALIWLSEEGNELPRPMFFREQQQQRPMPPQEEEKVDEVKTDT